MLKRVLFFFLGFFLMWALLFNCATTNASAAEVNIKSKKEVYYNNMYFYNDTPFPIKYTIVRSTKVPFYRDRDHVYSGEMDRYSKLSFYHPCGYYIIVVKMNEHFIFHPYKIYDWKPTRINLTLKHPMYKVEHDGTRPNTYHLVEPGSRLEDGR